MSWFEVAITLRPEWLHFQMYFLGKKGFHWIGSAGQHRFIDNGLAMNRWQVMTWNCDVPVYWLPHIQGYNDVIKWKNFPCYWPFVQGIHWSLVNSLHKGQWSGALMFSLIYAGINGWINNHEAGDFRRHCAHYDFIVMESHKLCTQFVLGCMLQWDM